MGRKNAIFVLPDISLTLRVFMEHSNRGVPSFGVLRRLPVFNWVRAHLPPVPIGAEPISGRFESRRGFSGVFFSTGLAPLFALLIEMVHLLTNLHP